MATGWLSAPTSDDYWLPLSSKHNEHVCITFHIFCENFHGFHDKDFTQCSHRMGWIDIFKSLGNHPQYSWVFNMHLANWYEANSARFKYGSYFIISGWAHNVLHCHCFPETKSIFDFQSFPENKTSLVVEIIRHRLRRHGLGLHKLHNAFHIMLIFDRRRHS